jgi:hypothetical protein
MKKLLLSVALAFAAVSASTSASAATFISFDGVSGTFGNNNVAGGSFDNTFHFTVASDGIAGATITSIRVSKKTNIDFSSVTLNGVELTTLSSGVFEARYLTLPVIGGEQTINVKGTSGGNASYAGTLAFAAVPEPATWAMMVGGFGLVGGAMRRRRQAYRIVSA